MNAVDLRQAFPQASSEFIAQNASEGVAGDSVRVQVDPDTILDIPILNHRDSIVDVHKAMMGSMNDEIFEPACSTIIRFTIMGDPIGKPRMTQRDKWAKRPCVLRYREWADKARASAPKDLPQSPNKIIMVAYLPFPKSYKEKKRKELQGKPHRLKPDADNLLKCIDALWDDDSAIWSKHIDKFWDDGLGPRIEIEVTP